ncbi:MAG: hypothetical protein Q9187_000827 [Circinaria calcarea]
MPLHLLGKKSWNVYNSANIEKVKRDESAAAAREAEEERRMQEVDAERRIRTLRGLPYESASPAEADSIGNISRNENGNGFGRERKRRRIEGEDDTNRDMRLANHNQQGSLKGSDGQLIWKATSDVPLTDRAGHINLFPVEGSRHRAPKNAEAEAEAAKTKKEYEDQYTMRFSNAAGFKQAVGRKPWYHDPATAEEQQEGAISNDVWGNEDPRRKEREHMRIVADDPLVMMQRGVQGLRQVEKERKRWREERAREMKDLAEAKRRRHRRKKRRGSDDDLNCFRLDAVGADGDGTRSSRAGNGKSHHRDRRSNSIGRGSSHRRKDGVGWEAGPGGRYSRQFAHVPGSTGFSLGVGD